MFINETIQTKVEKEYDVAVCGGGVAGIAAALAAARQGKKTVLFERQFLLGGLGTVRNHYNIFAALRWIWASGILWYRRGAFAAVHFLWCGRQIS